MWEKYTFLFQFKKKIVRDLAAVVCCPSILKEKKKSIEVPYNSWFLESYSRVEKKLIELDQDPTELVQFLDQLQSSRLGLYFEKLIHFWLIEEENWEVLSHNQQLQKDKITIGAFDFIFRDEMLQADVHLEVAVKFYLKVFAEESFDSYWGPSGKDCFKRKVNHLYEHQIPLSNTKEAKSFFEANNISIEQKWIFFKGQLFFDIDEFSERKKTASQQEDYLFGWHSTEKKFLEQKQWDKFQWAVIKRKQWLSPVLAVDEDIDPVYSLNKIVEVVKSQNNSQPTCVVGLINGKEVTRGFILQENYELPQIN